MKIAATYDNGNIFQHFGKTEFFKVYEVEDNKVVSSEVISSNGTGHGALAGLLAEQGISVLICGGIGGGAQSALAEAGIELCSGAQGDADTAVDAYLKGELVSTGVNCDHHHHEDGHSCGSHENGHSCGGHEDGHSCGGCGGGCGSGRRGNRAERFLEPAGLGHRGGAGAGGDGRQNHRPDRLGGAVQRGGACPGRGLYHRKPVRFQGGERQWISNLLQGADV